MLVRCLWHKLAISAASNAPAVQSCTFLKVGTGNTSANALSPQGHSRAELKLELSTTDPLLYTHNVLIITSHSHTFLLYL